MKVKQFRYSFDNLGYVVYSQREAIAIDGGAVEKIQAFIKDRGLDLIYATNTHSHADHTMGTSELIKKLNAKYKDHKITVARQFEPHNPDLDRYLKNYDPEHVRSTLADERKVNPYLRFNQESIIAILKGKGLPVDTENQRWSSVMTL